MIYFKYTFYPVWHMNDKDWSKMKKLVYNWSYNHANDEIIKNFSNWLGVHRDFMVFCALTKHTSHSY